MLQYTGKKTKHSDIYILMTSFLFYVPEVNTSVNMDTY